MNLLSQGFPPVRRTPEGSARRLASRRLRAGASAVLVGLATMACGGDDGPVAPDSVTPPPPVATTIEVAPPTAELSAIGETVQLTASVRDQDGNAMAGATVTWASSATAVASVSSTGVVTAEGNGTATITARSGSASATAAVTVMAEAAPGAGPAPPTDAAESVISLFSDAYNDVTVDTWSADWDQADVEDVEIAGDAAKKYTNLVFAGIEFTSATVDASAMTHLRMHIWTPDETATAAFRVKLVDFGADGAFAGGDDSEHEVVIAAAEGLASEEWVQLDLALADFGGLASRENLAQLIISGDPNTVYVDNVYFFSGEAPPPQAEPTEPAPTPGDPAADVISLFSDAYDDVTVDTWSADWDQANVEDVEIAGDAAKKYTGLVFAGIEFTSATIDASEMTHFRMHIWTPDETATAAFRVKLVDFGADGAFAGGDDSEHELTITAAEGLATEAWVQLDLPLADFTGLTSRENLAQLVISGDPNTVYVDNVHLRR